MSLKRFVPADNPTVADRPKWGDADNWDPSVPEAADDVRIDTLSSDVTAQLDAFTAIAAGDFTLTSGCRGNIGDEAEPLELDADQLIYDAASPRCWLKGEFAAAHVKSTRNGKLYLEARGDGIEDLIVGKDADVEVVAGTLAGTVIRVRGKLTIRAGVTRSAPIVAAGSGALVDDYAGGEDIEAADGALVRTYDAAAFADDVLRASGGTLDLAHTGATSAVENNTVSRPGVVTGRASQPLNVSTYTKAEGAQDDGFYNEELHTIGSVIDFGDPT